jgi:thiol-disulfide isomerase/thioredoxin
MEGYSMKLTLGIFTALTALFNQIGFNRPSVTPVFEAPYIREITSIQALEELLKTEKNLVIKFSTQQCPYCVYLDPFFKKAVENYRGPVAFAAVMISSDQNERNWYKATFKFATVPTVVYYKDGEKKLVHGSGDKTITDRDIFNNIMLIYNTQSPRLH